MHACVMGADARRTVDRKWIRDRCSFFVPTARLVHRTQDGCARAACVGS